jgi:uncharacterized protein (TIGR02452 family)
MSREKNKAIAEDTLKLIEKGFYTNNNGQSIKIAETIDKAIFNTKLYSPAELNELIIKPNGFENNKKTSYEVCNETTLNAARKLIEKGYKNVLCLNFASAKNVGGGFLNGSQAQEESIVRATGLYPCLLKCKEFYEENNKIKSCLYTDNMIYSPNVPIIKDEEGKYLSEFVTASFITAPAVNAGVIKLREPINVAKIEEIMKRRINMALRIMLENHHENIILGAWGCGVFGNNPADIAQYFKEIIKENYEGCFNKILFAVYSNKDFFIEPFKKDFI